MATEPAVQMAPQRGAAERFVRRLLRIGDQVDRNAILGAHRSTTRALVIAGIRCTITYLLVPVLAPFIGFLGSVDAPLSIALSVVAIVMGVSGVRRFWAADHRARWAYTGFIGVVLVLLVVGISLDLVRVADTLGI